MERPFKTKAKARRETRQNQNKDRQKTKEIPQKRPLSLLSSGKMAEADIYPEEVKDDGSYREKRKSKNEKLERESEDGDKKVKFRKRFRTQLDRADSGFQNSYNYIL